MWRMNETRNIIQSVRISAVSRKVVVESEKFRRFFYCPTFFTTPPTLRLPKLPPSPHLISSLPPGHGAWAPTLLPPPWTWDLGTYHPPPPPPPATDIWRSSPETCSNLLTWEPKPPDPQYWHLVVSRRYASYWNAVLFSVFSAVASIQDEYCDLEWKPRIKDWIPFLLFNRFLIEISLWSFIFAVSLGVTLVVDFAFLSKILGRWWEPTNDILSFLWVWVVRTLTGGEDTQTLMATIKSIWFFCTQRWREHFTLLWYPRALTPSHLVKLSLPNFFQSVSYWNRICEADSWKSRVHTVHTASTFLGQLTMLLGRNTYNSRLC